MEQQSGRQASGKHPNGTAKNKYINVLKKKKKSPVLRRENEGRRTEWSL